MVHRAAYRCACLIEKTRSPQAGVCAFEKVALNMARHRRGHDSCASLVFFQPSPHGTSTGNRHRRSLVGKDQAMHPADHLRLRLAAFPPSLTAELCFSTSTTSGSDAH